MTTPEELLGAASAILSHCPAGADVSGVRIDDDSTRRIVEISTRTPAILIGRQGSTADELRRILAEHLYDPNVQLNISQCLPPPDPDRA